MASNERQHKEMHPAIKRVREEFSSMPGLKNRIILDALDIRADSGYKMPLGEAVKKSLGQNLVELERYVKESEDPHKLYF